MNQHLIFNENIKSYDLNNILKHLFKKKIINFKFTFKSIEFVISTQSVMF
jgi:hypothetical protein